MEETDIPIRLKKIKKNLKKIIYLKNLNKDLKKIKQNCREAKKLALKLFVFFFLHCIKWKKSLDLFIFSEAYINKNKLQIYEKSINIDKVDIKRIVLSNKESHGNKGHINILLDIYIKAVPSHHHYG